MIRALALGFGGLCLAGPILAQDLPPGDAARGEGLSGQCRTCHGADGFARLPIAPHIAGDDESYLAAQLVAYRDGSRVNEMMSLVAPALSDQAIADLAAYYAAQPFFAAGPAQPDDAPELCVACHGANGMAEMEGVPHIAGDLDEYIENQLTAFRDGTRSSEIMSGMAAGLTDDEIVALAAWYAAIKVSATSPAQ